MASTAAKVRKKKISKANAALRLPVSTTKVTIGGVDYLITPSSDMQDWLEDMEDIIDSMKAMDHPEKFIPFKQMVKELADKPPARKRK